MFQAYIQFCIMKLINSISQINQMELWVRFWDNESKNAKY